MSISAPQIKTAKELIAKVLALLNPPPALSVWKWGELRRRMGKNVTAKAGPYRVASTPFQRYPQESFTALDVQVTVLYWAKRLGKTEMMNNLEGSVIEQSPRNILVVYPTLDSAKKWSKQFFAPMVKSTPILRKMIRDAKSKEASNTILSKEFPGGNISAIGTNSPSGFRQVQAPVVICDEIDAMENGPEGDPVTLAFGRAENYPDSIQVVASTATIKQTSRIEAWYEKSDKQNWFVPCHKCGTYQVLKWCQVKWPEGHRHEEAYYECENKECACHWNDAERVSAILAGEWRATAPFRGVRGFWLNGINTTFSPKKGYKTKMHQMASEFYDAYTSGEAARIAWKNTFLCEPHEEIAEKIDVAPLLERCEDYTPETLPIQAVLLIANADVQGDRVEVEVVAVGDNEETWGVEVVKIYGNPERPELWADLLGQLTKTYKRVDGVELKITSTAIDMRHKGKEVRRFIKTCGLPRVYGVYGSSGNQTALVLPRMNKHYRMFTYSVNTDAAKDIIFARLRLKDHGPRYMHFPKGFGYEAEKKFLEQMVAEEVRVKYSNGFPERYYFLPPGRRNEGLDVRVYSLANLDILKPSIKHIAASLKPSDSQPEAKDYILKPHEEAAQQPTPPKPTPKPFRDRPMGGNWVTGGKKWR
jgi:phage terminase large subunit GpA-like protein